MSEPAYILTFQRRHISSGKVSEATVGVSCHRDALEKLIDWNAQLPEYWSYAPLKLERNYSTNG
jgi:hypothetical protein